MRNMLAKKKDMQMWRPSDLPRLYTREKGTASFSTGELDDVSKVQGRRIRIKKALEKYYGDKTQAARELGLNKGDLLQDMLRLKIR